MSDKVVKKKVHFSENIKNKYNKLNVNEDIIKVTTPKGGRPRNVISLQEIKNLCAIQCTGEEIASVFNVDYDTVDKFIKKECGCGFSEFYKKHVGDGKASLRRMQYKLALAGNPTMLIWLGKQTLGQADKLDSDVNLTNNFELNIAKSKPEDEE